METLYKVLIYMFLLTITKEKNNNIIKTPIVECFKVFNVHQTVVELCFEYVAGKSENAN